jgi:hypothetical protein
MRSFIFTVLLLALSGRAYAQQQSCSQNSDCTGTNEWCVSTVCTPWACTPAILTGSAGTNTCTALSDLNAASFGVLMSSGYNWGTVAYGADPCSTTAPWFGISCNAQGVVTSINIQNRVSLFETSVLPSSISLLTGLEKLALAQVSFTGPIPNLPPNLQYVFLGWNSHTGSLPDVSSLSSLWYFNVYNNGPYNNGGSQSWGTGGLNGTLPSSLLKICAGRPFTSSSGTISTGICFLNANSFTKVNGANANTV